MNKKEKSELIEFVNKYRKIENSIVLMQKSIEEMAKKRDELFEDLDDIKNKEKVFMEKLVKKYGASEVTPYKLMQLYEEGV